MKTKYLSFTLTLLILSLIMTSCQSQNGPKRVTDFSELKENVYKNYKKGYEIKLPEGWHIVTNRRILAKWGDADIGAADIIEKKELVRCAVLFDNNPYLVLRKDYGYSNIIYDTKDENKHQYDKYINLMPKGKEIPGSFADKIAEISYLSNSNNIWMLISEDSHNGTYDRNTNFTRIDFKLHIYFLLIPLKVSEVRNFIEVSVFFTEIKPITNLRGIMEDTIRSFRVMPDEEVNAYWQKRGMKKPE